MTNYLVCLTGSENNLKELQYQDPIEAVFVVGGKVFGIVNGVPVELREVEDCLQALPTEESQTASSTSSEESQADQTEAQNDAQSDSNDESAEEGADEAEEQEEQSVSVQPEASVSSEASLIALPKADSKTAIIALVIALIALGIASLE